MHKNKDGKLYKNTVSAKVKKLFKNRLTKNDTCAIICRLSERRRLNGGTDPKVLKNFSKTS